MQTTYRREIELFQSRTAVADFKSKQKQSFDPTNKSRGAERLKHPGASSLGPLLTNHGGAPTTSDLHSFLYYKLISLPKSLITKTGGAEFAKRFRCHHIRKDFSPISMRKMTNTHHPHGLYAVLNLFKVKRFSTFCRLAGAGYCMRFRA